MASWTRKLATGLVLWGRGLSTPIIRLVATKKRHASHTVHLELDNLARSSGFCAMARRLAFLLSPLPDQWKYKAAVSTDECALILGDRTCTG